MRYAEILARCKGENVVINNGDERKLVDVCDDFIVLEGGNSQMKVTEFIQFEHITKVIRMDYATTGQMSLSMDICLSGGDQRRGGH